MCNLCVYYGTLVQTRSKEVWKFNATFLLREVNLPLHGKINPNYLKMANLMKLTIDIKGKQSPLKGVLYIVQVVDQKK